jgi:deoxycytidylate deaminase
MIEHAKKASEKGYGRFQLGAAIYDKKGRLISIGWNKQKTHPKYGSFIFNRIHAEGDALIKALKKTRNLKGAYIVVYRRRGNNAKPCHCCESMLRQAGIAKVYYTNGNKSLSTLQLN